MQVCREDCLEMAGRKEKFMLRMKLEINNDKWYNLENDEE